MLSSAAVAMQSICQLSWTCDPARDKQSKLDNGPHFQSSRTKPTADIPFVACAKRKRSGSTGLAPGSTTPSQHKLAKITGENGAVQPSSEPARQVETFVHGAQSLVWETAREGPTVVTSVVPADVPTTVTPAQAQASVAQYSGQGQSSKSVPPPPSRDLQEPDSFDMSWGYSGCARSAELDSSMEANADHLRSIVAAQIDLEILLKHNELRLIEQELAKCQVALEQIRRCELIPYPGSDGVSAAMVSGTGTALTAPVGSNPPMYPAPFGVADGPYTRHYAQWLLPDAMFDLQSTSPSAANSVVVNAGTRSGRGLAAEYSLPAVHLGRGSRTSGGNKSQLIAHDPSQPHRDPLLMKRESDGQWVRLVCTKCKPERANFQNIQGFLNHCRISHQDNYKSHEQAAIACGRPVEVDENSMPPPPTPQATTKLKISTSGLPVDTVLAQRGGSATGTPSTERPPERIGSSYNALAIGVPTQANQSTMRSLVLPRAFDLDRLPPVSTPTNESLESPFTGSPQTPHLSEILKRRSFLGDLGAVVAEAKTRIDTSAYDCSDSETEESRRTKIGKQKQGNSDSDFVKRPSAVTGRKPGISSSEPALQTKLPHNPSSTAPLHAPRVLAQNERSREQKCPSLVAQHHKLPKSPPVSPSISTADEMDSSPGITMESNPGLVSDHEGESDDADEDVVADPGSAAAYVSGPSMMAHRAASNLHAQAFAAQHSDMMDIDIHVEIQDASDGEGVSPGGRVRQRPGVEVTCSSRAGGAA